MDFELSDDQVALQEAAQDLLDGLSDPLHVRAHMATGEDLDAALWRGMVEQGWLGVAVPEDRGGLGLGWVEAAVLLEQVGAHTAPVPLLGDLVAIDALLVADHPAVDSLVAGDALGCVAWSRDPGAVAAEQRGGDWVLNGRPDPVIGASCADVAVVWTPEAVWAVDLGTLGRPARVIRGDA